MARGNYLAQDRTDIKFAVKELSKAMANPKMSDWDSLVNFARYLIGKEKHVQLFNYQRAMADFSLKHITVWSDTDYAGCPISRKSTSGGVCMLGGHVIKSWCSTQAILALSSGEAEYYGLVRGAAHGLGIRSLMKDLGIERR